MKEFLDLDKIEKSTKEQLLFIVDKYIEDRSLNGGDYLSDIAFIRKLSFVLDEMEKGVKELAMLELNNFNKNQTSVSGAFIKKIESAIRYDYSANNDWINQKQFLDIQQEKLKAIENQLKEIKEPLKFVTEDGEEKVLYPPIRSFTETIKVVID